MKLYPRYVKVNGNEPGEFVISNNSVSDDVILLFKVRRRRGFKALSFKPKGGIVEPNTHRRVLIWLEGDESHQRSRARVMLKFVVVPRNQLAHKQFDEAWSAGVAHRGMVRKVVELRNRKFGSWEDGQPSVSTYDEVPTYQCAFESSTLAHVANSERSLRVLTSQMMEQRRLQQMALRSSLNSSATSFDAMLGRSWDQHLEETIESCSTLVWEGRSGDQQTLHIAGDDVSEHVARAILEQRGAELSPHKSTAPMVEICVHSCPIVSLLWLDKSLPSTLHSITSLIINRTQLRVVDVDLSFLTHLRTLDLSHNCIEGILYPLYLPRLVHLDVSHNRLRQLANCEFLQSMKFLDASHNALSDMTLFHALVPLRTLANLSLSNNPITTHMGLRYTRKVLETLPDLQTLDGSDMHALCGYGSPRPIKQNRQNVPPRYMNKKSLVEGRSHQLMEHRSKARRSRTGVVNSYAYPRPSSAGSDGQVRRQSRSRRLNIRSPETRCSSEHQRSQPHVRKSADPLFYERRFDKLVAYLADEARRSSEHHISETTGHAHPHAHVEDSFNLSAMDSAIEEAEAVLFKQHGGKGQGNPNPNLTARRKFSAVKTSSSSTDSKLLQYCNWLSKSSNG